MGNNTIVVMKFKTPTQPTSYRFELVESPNGWKTAFEISISQSAGVIPTSGCRVYNGSDIRAYADDTKTPAYPSDCVLKQNTAYYVQVRWTTPEGMSTCNPPYTLGEPPGGTCGMRVALFCNYANGMMCELPDPGSTTLPVS